MSKLRKTLIGVAIVGVAIVAFITWYQMRYSMDVAQPFEVNAPGAQTRVLIATQGSEFKNAVVAGVVDHLKARSAYVKVIDLSGLSGVNENEWSAIVLLHTWEMSEPPADAKAFVARAQNPGKIVALSTSGAGKFKIEGVDAISSASTLADVPARVAAITGKVDAILGAAAPTQ